MKRFRNILCVVSGEKANTLALDRATSLAVLNQAKLTVISVMAPVSIGMGMPERGPISTELQRKAFEKRTQNLQEVIEPFRHKLDIESHVLIGVRFLQIIRKVLSNQHDLVIKAPESEEWLDHLLGSEDMHLLRKCPCPVWLIKPSPQAPFRRVLAAVDVTSIYPESERTTRQNLNQKIIEMAGSLALADAAELHIVHAWEVMSERTLRELLLQRTEFDMDTYVAKVRKERQSEVDQIIQSPLHQLAEYTPHTLRHQLHIIRGRARKEVSVLAKKLKVDLVVMGTVARTGIPGLFTGNTAESILSQIDCSVLAIKPSGFETPVTLP